MEPKGGDRQVHFGGPVRPQGVTVLFHAPANPRPPPRAVLLELLAKDHARSIFTRNPEALWQQMERKAFATPAALRARAD